MLERLNLGDLKILQIIRDKPLKVGDIVRQLDKDGIKASYYQIWKRLNRLTRLGIVDKAEIEVRVKEKKKSIMVYKLKKELRKELDETISLLLL